MATEGSGLETIVYWMLEDGRHTEDTDQAHTQNKEYSENYIFQVIFEAFKLRDWKSIDWLLESQKDPRYWVVISVVLWRSSSINST